MAQIRTIGTPAALQPLALVTGASSGIGLALAREFARNGYEVLLVSHSDRVLEAARELQYEGLSATPFKADLATYDGVEKVWAHLRSLDRPIELLAINAGIGVHGDFARATDLQAHLQLLQLNVVSAVHLAKRVVEQMVARNRGKILFTSSIAATTPGPFESTYAASKSFLQSFSHALRNELRDTEITVTSLLPGPTKTDFFRRAGMQDTKLGRGKKDDPALVARQAFEGLLSGKAQVVAGSPKNRVQALLAKFVPEPVKARIHRSRSEPLRSRRKAA